MSAGLFVFVVVGWCASLLLAALGIVVGCFVAALRFIKRLVAARGLGRDFPYARVTRAAGQPSTTR